MIQLRDLLGEPLLHLFVLGLAVFGLHTALDRGSDEAPDDPSLVEVSSADIEWFRTLWKKRMGREPTVEELRGQVNQIIRERVLEREAVRMGLDKDDVVVRRRLAQKMEFLFKDLAALTEPSDEDLRRYLEENRTQYETPVKVTFTQVFFNTDERGVDGAEQAVEALLKLPEAVGGEPQDPRQLGDPTMLPSRCEECDPREIQGRFGAAFAEKVENLAPGSWHGPVMSGYGLHAVYVHDHSNARPPAFDEIKQQLKADWLSERQRESTWKTYQELRSQYTVLLEGMPYHVDLDRSQTEE